MILAPRGWPIGTSFAIGHMILRKEVAEATDWLYAELTNRGGRFRWAKRGRDRIGPKRLGIVLRVDGPAWVRGCIIRTCRVN